MADRAQRDQPVWRGSDDEVTRRGQVRTAYNAWSSAYDHDANKTRDLNASLLRTRELGTRGARILECGCGTGGNTASLAREARHVVGLDLSEGMLARARRRLAGTPARVDLVQTDLTAPWPVRPGFDLVVVTLVLEHVDALAHVHAEARRVLRPGGHLYLAELHPDRQRRGSQARYRDASSGEEAKVPAVVRDLETFVEAGKAAGFELRQLGEHFAPGDEVLRLVSLWWGRS